jgi:hypothetical protein
MSKDLLIVTAGFLRRFAIFRISSAIWFSRRLCKPELLQLAPTAANEDRLTGWPPLSPTLHGSEIGD